MLGTLAIAALFVTMPVQKAAVEDIKPISATTIEGKAVAIPDKDASATVLVFLLTDCPIANRYAPELKRIERDYAKKDVKFYRVYVYADATTEEIAQHTKDFDYKWAAIHDKEKQIIEAVDARVTPEVAVIGRSGKLLYMGRIDDMYIEHGRLRESGYRLDLRIALDEVLAGKAVTLPRTTALGCFIDRT